MPSTNKTAKGLSQFIGTDCPSWLKDYNNDMKTIDEKMWQKADLLSTPRKINGVPFDGSKDIEIAAKGGGGINENLLGNGCFQVNQRGAASYTANGITVDRWVLKNAVSSNSKIEVTANGIKFSTLTSTPSSIPYLSQLMESTKNILSGRKVTLSLKYKSTTGDAAIKLLDDSLPLGEAILPASAEFKTFTKTFSISQLENDLRVNIFAHNAGGINSIELQYIKLEAGENATECIPLVYWEELRKCQRYYYKYNAKKRENIGFGLGDKQSNSFLYIFLPNPMKHGPIKFKCTSGITYNSNQSDVLKTYPPIESISTGACVIVKLPYCLVTSYIVSANQGYIEFDAEIS